MICQGEQRQKNELQRLLERKIHQTQKVVGGHFLSLLTAILAIFFFRPLVHDEVTFNIHQVPTLLCFLDLLIFRAVPISVRSSIFSAKVIQLLLTLFIFLKRNFEIIKKDSIFKYENIE